MLAAEMFDSLRPILDRYAAAVQPLGPVEPLGSAGGFSGAQFWRWTSALGPLGLRRWPREHPSPARLRWIHALALHVSRGGFPRVPLPLATRDGETFVTHGGHLWELAPWLPGQAEEWPRSHRPWLAAEEQPVATTQPPAMGGPSTSPLPFGPRVSAALRALAQFHLAAATMPGGTSAGAAPSATERLERLRALRCGGRARLATQVREREAQWPELAQRAESLFARFDAAAPVVEPQLERAAARTLPLQPCLRDIWSAHVLYGRDEVTGIVDLGAARIDQVATDVARLTGSLVGDDPRGWEQAIAAYTELRLLSGDELHLAAALDAAAVLMSGISWIEWVFAEGRTFADAAAVLRRVDENLARLAHLAKHGIATLSAEGKVTMR